MLRPQPEQKQEGFFKGKIRLSAKMFFYDISSSLMVSNCLSSFWPLDETRT